MNLMGLCERSDKRWISSIRHLMIWKYKHDISLVFSHFFIIREFFPERRTNLPLRKIVKNTFLCAFISYFNNIPPTLWSSKLTTHLSHFFSPMCVVFIRAHNSSDFVRWKHENILSGGFQAGKNPNENPMISIAKTKKTQEFSRKCNYSKPRGLKNT